MDKNELIHTVSLAGRGDKKAFERLYSEYYDKLYFFVLKNVGRKDAAEDITQETFLQSMEGLSDLERPEQYYPDTESSSSAPEQRFTDSESSEDNAVTDELTEYRSHLMLPDKPIFPTWTRCAISRYLI